MFIVLIQMEQHILHIGTERTTVCFYRFDSKESRTFDKFILSLIMPVENLEEQGLEKNPNLELAQWKYLLTTDKYKNDTKIKTNLLKAIETDSKCNSHVIKCATNDLQKRLVLCFNK